MYVLCCILLVSAFSVGLSSASEKGARAFCSKTFRDANITNVYLWDDWSCSILCMGSNKADKSFFAQMLNKTDTTPCSGIFNFDDNPRQCYKGVCQRKADLETCRGTLQSSPLLDMVVDECRLTCLSDSDDVINTTFIQDAGTPCTAKNYMPGKCDECGVCQESIIYVDDVEGIDPNADAATKMTASCQERHQGLTVGIMAAPDNCSCWCMFNNTKIVILERQAYRNGHPMPDNQACFSTVSWPLEQINNCQDEYPDDLTGMSPFECGYTCIAGSEKSISTSKSLGIGSLCQTMQDGWLPRSGTCDMNNTCVFE